MTRLGGRKCVICGELDSYGHICVDFLRRLAETRRDIAAHPNALTYDPTTKQFGPEPDEAPDDG